MADCEDLPDVGLEPPQVDRGRQVAVELGRLEAVVGR